MATVPMPEAPADADLQIRFQLVVDYYHAHALVLLLQSFMVMAGSAAMLRLVFARGGTVGGAKAREGQP